MNQFISDIRYRFRMQDTITRIIIINVVVFVVVSLIQVFYALSASDSSSFATILNYFKMRPTLHALIRQPWSIVTYMFFHAGVFHILFNMMVLFWMGKLFIEYLGERKFLAVYFLGGILGALFFFGAYNIFPMFKGHHFDTLEGASAGVLAVLIAIATLLPNYGVHLMFFGEVRLKFVALFLVIMFVINLAGGNAGGEFAHLGGALLGFIFTKQLQNGNDITAWIYKIPFLFSRNKKVSMKVVKQAPKRRTISDEEFRARKKFDEELIDSILDKISKSGYDSLSADEKEILFRASDKEK